MWGRFWIDAFDLKHGRGEVLVRASSRRAQRSLRVLLLATGSAFIGALASSAPAWAATEAEDAAAADVAAADAVAYDAAGDRRLDDGADIIVTAERRATPLQRTPVSVGVIGGDAIQDQKQTLLRDLSNSVAGLQVPVPTTPSLSYLFIRGIGTTSPTYNGAVGIYVDDVYQARIINSGVFGLPDVERIEVLRGPQGTLYGQNTSAGAIKIVSKTPDNDFTGSVSIAAGNHRQLNGNVYVSGPVVQDRLYASLAYAHENIGGFVYNATLDKKVNRVHTDQGRVKLRFTPSGEGGTDIVLSGYFLRDRSDNSALIPLNVPNPDPRVTYENMDLGYHNDAYLASLVITQPLSDGLTLKSISGYRHFKNDPDPWSQDGLPTDIFAWELNLRQKQLSQEVQLIGDLGPLNFTAGAIYYHEVFDVERPNVTFGTRGGIITKTVTDSIGIYGQAHYALTSRLGVTAGLRYYHQKDDYDNYGIKSDANFDPIAITYSLVGLRQKTSGVTPKAGIDYRFTDQIFGYASFTKGQKSGGYNPVAGAPAIAAIAVSPEKVTTYEAGLKFGSGRSPILFNITGFYNDFRNYQSLLSNVILNGTAINGSVAVNAKKARTYGVEVEATARPVRALELRVAATALNAKFVDFNFNTVLGVANYDGNRIPYTSRYNLGASAAYTFQLGDFGNLRVRGEVKHSSNAFSDITNNTQIPKTTFVNADVFLTTANEHWSVFGRVNNLFDKTYSTGIPKVATIPGVLATSYLPPRMFQVGARYSF
jgi:iron complex outermembrane receptor protein